MYTNEHQKCLLESSRRELESKKFELVALKATVAQERDSLTSNSAEEGNRANALERELRMVCLAPTQPLSLIAYRIHLKPILDVNEKKKNNEK